jgi:hypothetical protein
MSDPRRETIVNLLPIERDRVLAKAQQFLAAAPLTITSTHCPRSPGDAHDYYSEGDYWWQNPDDPSGPYIRRDGWTNPNAFFGHRRLLMALSIQVGAMTVAYKLTQDKVYVEHVAAHLRAWFVNPTTRLNPHLKYAQAIQGVCTGRGIGIIDTVQLVEVAIAVKSLRDAPTLASDYSLICGWFAEYLCWITTHPNGIDEREEQNNHGTAWVLQAAAFAHLVDDANVLAECRRRFEKVLLPNQMAPDGSFPRELARTKPYGYSIFNLDLLAGICQLLSTPLDNIWRYASADGRDMRRAIEFMYPFLKDKNAWPFAHDVMHWDEWPSQPSSLVLAGIALNEPRYMELWHSLAPNTDDEEIVRNTPIRQPLLWL